MKGGELKDDFTHARHPLFLEVVLCFHQRDTHWRGEPSEEGPIDCPDCITIMRGLSGPDLRFKPRPKT